MSPKDHLRRLGHALRRRPPGRRAFRAPLAPGLEPLESRRLLATFTVTSGFNSSGGGTLRQVILDANSNPGPDAIGFNVGGQGAAVKVISVTPALPALTGQTTIDGLSQPTPRPASRPWRSTAGAASGRAWNWPPADNSVVRSLILINFRNDAIDVASSGSRIQGNWVGLDTTGNGHAGLGRRPHRRVGQPPRDRRRRHRRPRRRERDLERRGRGPGRGRRRRHGGRRQPDRPGRFRRLAPAFAGSAGSIAPTRPPAAPRWARRRGSGAGPPRGPRPKGIAATDSSAGISGRWSGGRGGPWRSGMPAAPAPDRSPAGSSPQASRREMAAAPSAPRKGPHPGPRRPRPARPPRARLAPARGPCRWACRAGRRSA